MTEAEVSAALEAAARAGDVQAKAFLRMWYARRSATKADADPAAPRAASR